VLSPYTNTRMASSWNGRNSGILNSHAAILAMMVRCVALAATMVSPRVCALDEDEEEDDEDADIERRQGSRRFGERRRGAAVRLGSCDPVPETSASAGTAPVRRWRGGTELEG